MKTFAVELMFTKDYYYGKGSNYFFGYDILRHRIVWLDRFRKISRFIRSGKLLDVGCAFGFFVEYMKNRGFDAYGIDVSKYAIGRCAKFGKNRFRVGNIERGTTFPKNSFDLVSAFDVIEHTKNASKALINIYGTLKNDGIVAIFMPLKTDGIKKIISKDADKTHFWLPTENKLDTVLNKVGFRILKKYYYLNLFGLVVLPIGLKTFGTNILVIAKKQ